MKKKRFTEEQIAFALRQAEGCAGASSGASRGRDLRPTRTDEPQRLSASPSHLH